MNVYIKAEALEPIEREMAGYRLNHKKVYEMIVTLNHIRRIVGVEQMKKESIEGKIFLIRIETMIGMLVINHLVGTVKTDFAPRTHLRIHPLLDWTELDVWEYIKRENILQYHCIMIMVRKEISFSWLLPLHFPVDSNAKNVDDIRRQNRKICKYR